MDDMCNSFGINIYLQGIKLQISPDQQFTVTAVTEHQRDGIQPLASTHQSPAKRSSFIWGGGGILGKFLLEVP